MDAWLGLGTGAAFVGFGTAIALDHGRDSRSSAARALAVTESLMLGGMMLGNSMFLFSEGPSHHQERYARFKRDEQQGGISEGRLAQYEGELYAAAQSSAQNRRMNGWVYLGAALGGAGLLALATSPDLRGGARGLAILEGAVLLPLGIVQGALAFANESSTERVWRSYRLAQDKANAPGVSVTPLVSASAVFLVGTGRF